MRGCETTAAVKKKKTVGSVAVCVPCRSSEKLMGRMVGGSLPLQACDVTLDSVSTAVNRSCV